MRRTGEAALEGTQGLPTRLLCCFVLATALGCNVPQRLPPTVPAAARSGTWIGGPLSGSPRGAGTDAVPLSSDDAYVVRIVAPSTSCSGTLISEQLVLTAHHCVALRNGAGQVLPADLAPERLTVEFGSGHFPWAEGKVRAIVAPTCGYGAGAGDLAILVLNRRMRGISIMKPALDREPSVGDEITHVGFGRCALSDDGIYLKHRTVGQVDLVTGTGFRTRAPLCPGDSGGPAIDRNTGLLMGVVSAGAMDGDESTPDRVEYARMDTFRSLFANAERIARGAAPSELPPVDCPAITTEAAPRVTKRRHRRAP